MSGHVLFIHINQLAPVSSPDTIPISEATILAYLKAHGFMGQILGDLADSPLKPSVLAEALQRDEPLAIGFTAYQENMEQIRIWARLAKSVAPSVQIILGGPQVTFMPSRALFQMPEVDFLCRGEGEEVMLRLTLALSRKEDLSSVPGLCLLREGEVIETGPAPGARHLDTYPSPYLSDLIDLRHKGRAIMMTSRGCPYDCAFCYTPKASHRKIRYHSVDRIVEEMKHLRSRGIESFWFADPNFSFSRKRLVKLLESIVEQVPGINFWCQTRYDLVDESLLLLLKKAGADNVAYGLESANPAVLEKINKSIDLERLSAIIRMTQEADINVELFSMFGLPAETFDQALGTLEFMKSNRVHIDGNSISQQAHLFFGTPMNNDPAAYGIRVLPRTRPAYLSPCREFETDSMSADEIRRMGLIWRVNRADFDEDVRAERNLFHRAGLIAQNRRDLSDRPEAIALLARIYLILEEYAAAAECMKLPGIGVPARLPAGTAGQEGGELLKWPVQCFRLCGEQARPGFRVIYDCRGSVSGRPVPAVFGRFQEAVIGKGMLLSEFEGRLVGMAAGEERRFDMVFPPDYGQDDLAGQTVTFTVHLHYAMEPVTVDSAAGLGGLGLANDYRLDDIQGLRRFNMNLCYRVLNRANTRGEPVEVTHLLMLINFYLKLGFVERAADVVEKLRETPMLLTHAAHLFNANAYPDKALELLDGIGKDGPRERMIRARALFNSKRYVESEALVRDMAPANDLQIAEMGVNLAAELCLPIEVLLERVDALLDVKTEMLLRPRQ